VGSDGFGVDLGALSAAHDRMERLAAELAKPLRDVPSAVAVGHERLHSAVTDFADRERRGLAMLSDEAESIRYRLAETIRTYRERDEDAAGRFGDIEP